MGNVREHCHAGPGSERARLLSGQRRDGLQAVVDLHPGLESVQARDLDQVVGKVDRGDVRALARQRLAEQAAAAADVEHLRSTQRSEEHTSELQSLMRISYAVFCLKKNNHISF